MKSLTIELMQQLAGERSGECLSTVYVNAQTKLEWKCGKGHIWFSPPMNIRSGQWCPDCAGNRRYTIGDIKELAASRGGKCLSGRYRGSHVKLKWKCGEGHRWSATPASVRHGTWCPICGHKKTGRKRGTVGEMKELARSKGGKCTSGEYVNSRTKLSWSCEYGHEWRATPNEIQQGGWCPRCAGKRWTIEDMRRLAGIKRGECLSDKYLGAKEKLKWGCKNGHFWEATPSNIRKGSWCPECGHVTAARKRRRSIRELQAYALSRGGECLSTEYRNPRTKIRWRCRMGHEWEATYNGIKGGRWCPVCGRESTASKNRRSIEEVQQIARSRGGELLSEIYINPLQKLHWRCKIGHEWKASLQSVGIGKHWCPHCAGVAKHTIEGMKALAKKRGGKCLSDEYINTGTKLKWVCEKGHEWEATFTSAKRSWCLLCQRPSIEDMRDLARKKGGECMSDEYLGMSAKLMWRCAKGHIWETVPGSLVYGNHWCPHCAQDPQRLGIEEMRRMAKARGGRCLSGEYINVGHPLLWECSKGHTFERPPTHIRQNNLWCPECKMQKRKRKKMAIMSYPLKKRRNTIGDMRRIALDLGGFCLSRKYVDEDTDLEWVCGRGHTWSAPPKDVRKGKWCPQCKPKRKRR